MAERALWTLDEAAAGAGGRLSGRAAGALNGVSIDTRSIAPGDLFVALKGDSRDGHDFVVQALQAGAGAALVSRVTPEMEAAGALIVVPDDVLKGLERLGRAARARSTAGIAAITGSVGKTSTKEMLRAALSACGATHASAASFNNHWGVPLTLARMPATARFGIFEIGMNHVGEITPLVAMVRPQVAVITNVAASHLGNFASLDEIAAAKAEIFTGVEKDGTAVLNRDSAHYEFLAAQARAQGIRHIVGFGMHAEAAVRIEDLVLHTSCSCVTAAVMGERVMYKLGVPGEHMALNSLAVLATAKLLGADLARAALALAEATPAKGRGQQSKLTLPGGELLLIDESYNANPASMAAALALLGRVKPRHGGRRIAVLGDMLELGRHSAELHAGLARPMDEQGIDVLYAAGPDMAHLFQAIPAGKRGVHAARAADLEAVLLASLRAGDVVMIKGSNGSRMGPLADAIRAKWPPANKDV